MNLDIIPNGAIKRVHVSQNDVGRTLTFELFNNSTSYTVPSGATVKIQGTKPSGFGFSETCSVSGNVVTVDTTSVMTDEHGYIDTELQIKYNDNTIGTSNFVLAVERNPHPDTITDGSTATIIPELTLLVNEVKGYAEEIEGTYHAYGSPWVASTVAEMTDTDKIYVYTGSETGYTNGNWYYYNGTAWVSGGVYNAVAVQTDKTLSVEDMPADAKATGDAIGEISETFESTNWFDHENAELTNLMSTPVLVSPKMAVNAGDTFYLSYHLSSPTNLTATPFFTIRYYDVNGTLTGNAGFWVQGVTIPNGTVEVQFIVAQTTAQYIMVSKDAVATIFEEYFESYVSAIDLVARENIQELQDNAVMVEEAFVMTDKFYGVANHEMNMYYENGIQYGDMNTIAKCDISGALTSTERFRDRLIWKPTTSGTTSETISLYKSNTKEPTLSKNIDFVCASESAGSGTKKVIVIGDSKVAYGQPTGYMQGLFEDDSITLELVGTRWGNNCTDSDTTNRHEGRASWGAYQYCLAPSYGGLTNPFYNANFTDTVYHTHFDFSKYMTDQGYSGIDYVIINLGTNDFGNTTYIYRSMISAMIKSIKAYDANIKIIIGLFEGVYVPKLEWATRNASFMEFRKAVIVDHANESNVYLNPQYLSMSLYDDYAYTDVPLSYADEFLNDGKTRRYVADGIHQNPAGFYKNAVSMYAIIKCIEAGLV